MAILIDRHKHKLIRTFYRNKWKKFNLKKYSRKNFYEFMIFHFIFYVGFFLHEMYLDLL